MECGQRHAFWSGFRAATCLLPYFQGLLCWYFLLLLDLPFQQRCWSLLIYGIPVLAFDIRDVRHSTKRLYQPDPWQRNDTGKGGVRRDQTCNL